MKLSELLIEPEVNLELAPLIDVLFLIVLFYAVSSSLISPEDLANLKQSLVVSQSESRQLAEDANAQRSRIAALESDLKRSGETILLHERDLSERASRLKTTEEALATARAAATAHESRISRLDQELEARTRELTGQNQRLSQTAQSLAAAQATLAERETTLARREQELEARNRELAGQTLRLTQTSQALTAAQATLAEREAALARREQELASQAQRIVLSDQQLDKLRAELASSQQAAGALERERGSAAAALIEAQRKLEQEQQALEQERAAHQADLSRLSAELQAMRLQVDALTQDNARFGAQQQISQERLQGAIEAEKRLNTNLKTLIDDRTLSVTRISDRLVLELSDKILFDSGSDELKPVGLPVLENVARVLAQRVQGVQIEIGGHTDNVPLGRANRLGSNWALSAARAVRVVQFFENRSGIESSRMAAVGYGEFRPIAGNDTPEGRSRNRRIEIVLVAK